jgi:tetratricopeptide (TPR) repeat protein
MPQRKKSTAASAATPQQKGPTAASPTAPRNNTSPDFKKAMGTPKHSIRRVELEHQVQQAIEQETSKDDSRCGTVFLVGPGGSGKTVLASQVAEARRAKHVAGPFAIGCNDVSTLKHTLWRHIQETVPKDSDLNLIVEEFVTAFTRNTTATAPVRDTAVTKRLPPLLVVDDACDLDHDEAGPVVAALRTLGSHCVLLVTSRAPAPVDLMHATVDMPGMTAKEVRRLRAAVTKLTDAKDRRDLSETDVARLLTASDQRIFIVVRLLFVWLESDHATFAEYATASRATDANMQAPGDDFQESVQGLMNYEYYLAQAKMPAAADILGSIQHLRFACFSEWPFTWRTNGEGNENKRALDWLESRHLITRLASPSSSGSSSAPAVFRVHSLVLGNLACAAVPDKKLASLLAREIFPEKEQLLVDKIYADCHRCWLQAIAGLVDRCGAADGLESDVKTIHGLCLAACRAGKAVGELPVVRGIVKALFFDSTRVRDDDTHTHARQWKLEIINDALNLSIDPHVAAELLQVNFDLWERHEGAVDSEPNAAMINNIGWTMQAMGNYDQGRALLHRGLEMLRRVFKGVDHPSLAAALNNVGWTGMGRPEFGLELQREALAMRRRLYPGRDHPDLAASLNTVGSTLVKMGQRKEGIKIQRKGLAMRRRLYRGFDHPRLAVSINDLACSLLAVLARSSAPGDSDAPLMNAAEGETLLREALEMYRRLYKNVKHANLAMSMSNYGRWLVLRWRCDEGIDLQERALAMMSTVVPGAHPADLAAVRNNLGLSLLESGRAPGTALAHLNAALEARSTLPDDAVRPDIASSLNNVGCAMWEMGQQPPDLASQELERALLMLQPSTSEDRTNEVPDLAVMLNNVGLTKSATGQEGGGDLLKQGLAMIRRLYPSADHPDVAAMLNNVGCWLVANGQQKEGCNKLQESLDMYHRLYGGTQHPDVATAQNNVACASWAMDGPDHAALALREALDAMRQLYAGQDHPQDHPTLAVLMTNVGQTSADGIEILKESRAMRQRLQLLRLTSGGSDAAPSMPNERSSPAEEGYPNMSRGIEARVHGAGSAGREGTMPAPSSTHSFHSFGSSASPVQERYSSPRFASHWPAADPPRADASLIGNTRRLIMTLSLSKRGEGFVASLAGPSLGEEALHSQSG